MRSLPLSLLVLASACATSSMEKGEVVSARSTQEEARKAFAGRRFALLVGVPGSTDEHWRPLRFAKKDVADLAAVLEDPLRGHFAAVESLSDPSLTTRAELLAAVDRLAAHATEPEDIIVLYVSAHGTLAVDGKGTLDRYLVSSDADFHHVSQTALRVDDVLARLEKSRSRRRVVILATCHSGSGKSNLPEEVSAELASRKGTLRPLEDVSRATVVLSASDFLETAREDEKLQNDVYTHFFVEALEGGADRNGDGAVTATEAHDFARRRTWAFSEGRQRPAAELSEVGVDPVVLTGDVNRTGQPELYSYVPRLDGFTVRIDGDARLELPGGTAVPAGAHRVELVKGDTVLTSQELELQLGQRLDVDRLAHEAEPHHAISAIGGAVGFIDDASRQRLLPAVPTAGLAVRFERVLLDHVSIEADLTGFGGQATVTPSAVAPGVPFGWSAFVFGASIAWQWDWKPLSVWVGPRVAGLWVQRSFALDAYQATQSAFSVTPGLLLGAAVHLTTHWELSLGAQGMVALVVVDGATQALGFAGAWGGVGYRW